MVQAKKVAVRDGMWAFPAPGRKGDEEGARLGCFALHTTSRDTAFEQGLIKVGTELKLNGSCQTTLDRVSASHRQLSLRHSDFSIVIVCNDKAWQNKQLLHSPFQEWKTKMSAPRQSMACLPPNRTTSP